MANNHNLEQRKRVLKQYWKMENAKCAKVDKKPTTMAIIFSRFNAMQFYCIRDKFETLGSVCNAQKSGHPKIL